MYRMPDFASMPVIRLPRDLADWPLRPHLGVFGKKWTLPLIRDLHVLGEARYSDMRRRNEGLSDRVLSLRLRDLREEGLVERFVDPRDRRVSYRLTPRGRAAMGIVDAFLQFGILALADQIYPSEDNTTPHGPRIR
jgi:DNA-binding HxlR family transcriptional regulator